MYDEQSNKRSKHRIMSPESQINHPSGMTSPVSPFFFMSDYDWDHLFDIDVDDVLDDIERKEELSSPPPIATNQTSDDESKEQFRTPDDNFVMLPDMPDLASDSLPKFKSAPLPSLHDPDTAASSHSNSSSSTDSDFSEDEDFEDQSPYGLNRRLLTKMDSPITPIKPPQPQRPKSTGYQRHRPHHKKRTASELDMQKRRISVDRFKAIMGKSAKSYDVESIVSDLGATEDGFIDLRSISSYSGNVKSKENVFDFETSTPNPMSTIDDIDPLPLEKKMTY